MNSTTNQNEKDQNPSGSELGKKIIYDLSYNPERLYPIPRKEKRIEIGIDPIKIPFFGFDCWNHYEVSWLNEKGKPIVAIAEIYYDCASPKIVESKSLKLYFNSLNHFRSKNAAEIEKLVKKDLEKIIESEVIVHIYELGKAPMPELQEKFSGICLDDLDIECDCYTVKPDYLSTKNEQVQETLYSDLLKSNCLVTNQPDWGSVQISYQGSKIDHAGLLKYLVSYRNHNEFHEQCIERIFADIMHYCKPSELSVYGRYTRRGGLDINPYRSTKKIDFKNLNFRLLRQ